MKLFGFLLRLYSYLFHLILSLFLLATAAIAGVSHQALNLSMLPFGADHLLRAVLLLGLAGLLSTVLAIARRIKYLFPIWAGYVVYLLVSGFVFSSYKFAGTDAFEAALWLILAALAAFLGALWTLKPRRGRLHF